MASFGITPIDTLWGHMLIKVIYHNNFCHCIKSQHFWFSHYHRLCGKSNYGDLLDAMWPLMGCQEIRPMLFVYHYLFQDLHVAPRLVCNGGGRVGWKVPNQCCNHFHLCHLLEDSLHIQQKSATVLSISFK